MDLATKTGYGRGFIINTRQDFGMKLNKFFFDHSGSLFLLALLLFSDEASAASCKITRECGTAITKDHCHSRGCCYMVTPLSFHNCFQSTSRQPAVNHPTTRDPRPDPVEILPPDAVQLSASLDRELDLLKVVGKNQVTKAKAVHIANLLENHLRAEAQRGYGTNWNFKKKGVFYAVIRKLPNTFLDTVKFGSGTVIDIDPGHYNIKNKNISFLIFIEYLTLAKILKGDQDVQPMCPNVTPNVSVVSVNAYDHVGDDVSLSLSFSLNGMNKTTKAQKDASCVYLNETAEHWSSYGCYGSVSPDTGSMKCFCNHTTKFSIEFAVSVSNFTTPKVHKQTIMILEYVMEGLSFVCLVITFFSLILVLRRSKTVTSNSAKAKERTKVHTNFVAALGALHIFRLVSGVAHNVDGLCASVTLVSHYFMLASGMWMLIEGIVLYNVIVKSLKFTKLGWMKYVAGWGIPGVIVLISSAIGLSGGTYVQKVYVPLECPSIDDKVNIVPYGTNLTYEYCWLSIQSNMIWAATGPLIAIFAVNLFILTHTVSFVLRLSLKTDAMKPSNHKSQKFKHLWNTTKGILVLFPILGVPWLLGFLVNIHDPTANIVFQYIHVTLNGLQGVFIFILYTAVNKEARDIVYRVANNRWQQHKISSSRSASLTPKEKFKKSVSSILGTPTHRKKYYPQRYGSNSHMSLQSNYTLHRPSSGSSSVNSTMIRTKRKYSTGSIDPLRSGHFTTAGFTSSLPRGWGYRNTAQPQMTKTASLKSVQSDHSGGPNVCAICKTSRNTCRHAAGSVSGLNLEAGDKVQSYYEFQMTIGKELPSSLNQRWNRMTAEEFKRFSAIPEEKRRSGVNSFYLEANEGMSSTQLAWDKKAKTLERTNVASQSSMKQYSIVVDIHADNNDDTDYVPLPEIIPSEKATSAKQQAEKTAKAAPRTPMKAAASAPKKLFHMQSTKNREMINKHFPIKDSKRNPDTTQKFSVPTPKHSKRKSERMSAYSDSLMKAIEKWRKDEERLKRNSLQSRDSTLGEE